MTNSECIGAVQGNLVLMAKLICVEAKDSIDVVGVEIPVSQQAKQALKQALNSLKVECITTLNQISM